MMTTATGSTATTPLLSQNNHDPNAFLNTRLTYRNIRPFIEERATELQNLIVEEKFFCLFSTVVAVDQSQKTYREPKYAVENLPKRIKLLRFAPCALSLIAVATATLFAYFVFNSIFTQEQKENGSTALATIFFGLSAISIASAIVIIFSLYYPKRELGGLIARDINELTRIILNANDDMYIPPQKVAQLLSEFNFSDLTVCKILSLATNEELKVIFDHLIRMNAHLNHLCSPHHSLLALLNATQPLSVSEFRSHYLIASPLVDEGGKRLIRSLHNRVHLPVLATTTVSLEGGGSAANPDTRYNPETLMVNSLRPHHAIDIPDDRSRPIVLLLDSKTLVADRRKLMQNSGYFRYVLSEIAAITDTRRLDLECCKEHFASLAHLIEGMENGFESLIEKAQDPSLFDNLALMNAAIFFEFDGFLDLFINAMLSSRLSYSDLSPLISTYVHKCPAAIYERPLVDFFNKVLVEHSIDANCIHLENWMEMCVKLKIRESLAYYKGWLTASDYLRPVVLFAVVKNRKVFAETIPKIILIIRKKFGSLHLGTDKDITLYANNDDFRFWLAEVMLDPTHNLISISNFKGLWHCQELSGHPEIKNVLIEFARNNLGTDGVTGLWHAEDLPDELTDALLPASDDES